MVLFTRFRDRGAARPGRSRRLRAAAGLSTEWLERRQMLSGLSILEQGIVSRSESAAADPAQVVVGEIVRYRAVLSVAEGTVAESESRLTVTLPAGLAFLDDGTATVALVSDGGLASGIYAPGDAAYVTGSSAVSPTAGVASGGLAVEAGSVSFEFGSLANADADEDGELVVLEFNLLVTNVADSGAGTALVAAGGVVVDGEQVALEELPSVTVAVGSIEGLSVTTVGPDDQTPVAGPILAGDQVRARIAFTVAAGEFAAALYEVRVAAPLPAGLALDPASLRVLVNGSEAAGVVDDSTVGGLVVTIPAVAPGDAVVVLVDATIDAAAEAGVPLAVEAAVTAASLPQGTGTAPNATGSVVPGGRGTADGARDGSDGPGGLNDLAWTAAASVVPFTIDLAIAKTAGFGVHSPGGPVTYTVVVSNDSLGFVAGASVVDRVPVGLADVSWQVAYAGQGSGPAAGGPAAGATVFGDIDVAIDLAAGGTATFTVTGTYAGEGGPLVNEATVTPPPGRADVNPANDRAVVETTFEDRVDLAVTISDGRLAYSPGQGLTYQVTVTNAGPGIAAGTRVLAVVPTGVTQLGWTATFTAGASGSAGEIGPLDTTATLPPGGTAVYTLVVTSAADVRGPLTTVATATAAAGLVDAALADNAAGDTNRLPVVVTGAEGGARSRPEVSVIDPASGAVLARFLAYERGFRGGVRVALGDVDGDGLEEVVTAPGPGRVGEIRVFRQDGTELTAFRTLPFGRGWRAGVEVAAGDVDGNGRDDIVAARSRGNGEVRVFLSEDAPDPIRNAAQRRIVPFGRGFNGGATVAVADVGSFAGGRLVDGAAADGRVEIVVGSGPGVPPLVRIYDVSAAPRVVATVRPFTAALRGGVAVTSGRITADDIDEIVVSAGRGGRGAVEVYDGLLNQVPAGGLARVSAAFAAFARPNPPLFLAPVDLTGNGRIDRLFATLGDPHAGAGVAAFSPTGELIGAAVPLAGPLRIAAARPPRTAPDGDLVTTPSGLQYRDLVVGTGPVPAVGQLVTAHYTGTLLDGTVFDSSRDRGAPFQFRLGQGQVIAGWDEAFATMRVGGQRILIIPPDLAYGAFPPPGSAIPPDATLVFDVELLAIG